MIGGLPLYCHGAVEGVRCVEIRKVLGREEAVARGPRREDFLFWSETPEGVVLADEGEIRVAGIRDSRIVRPGDVVRLRPGSSLISVVWRRGVRGNVLFTTERCNSLCVMCSQPPRDEDDSWRVSELLRTIPLIDPDTPQIGISGGEPTLLGEALADILNAIRMYHPAAGVHVLTNGRAFSDPALAERLALASRDRVTWAIPLYGDVAVVHDEVVAVEGAYAETLDGLYELGRLGARIEIRVVVHALTAPRLGQLAAFIYRRLPFVSHVALMGLEPMGLAKRNRDRVWIDPADYVDALVAATFHLANRGVPVSIYNLPLCVLPRDLWPFARQSISDWKNAYPSECAKCALKDHCAGFFASAGPEWRSRNIRPYPIEEFAT